MSADKHDQGHLNGDVRSNSSPGLKERWKRFWLMWLEPWNLALFAIMVAMYALGVAELKGAVGVLSQTVLALASGVLGGRIANNLAELNAVLVLRARGTVAVRGLKLLLRNIQAIEHRVRIFQEEGTKPDFKSEVAVARLDETLEMVRVLQEEAVSSIENWTDIVPEAQSSTLVG